MIIKYTFVVLFAIHFVHGAKILGVFPMAGVSHHILASKLLIGLADAGHDVTMISPYEVKDRPTNGSFTEILLDGFQLEFQVFLKELNIIKMESISVLNRIKIFTENMVRESNKTFHHPKVKKLLNSNASFDAVIMEQFNNDALKVFSYIYECPLITLSAMGPNSLVNPTVGNPQPISYIPHLFMESFSPDSMNKRAKNVFFHVLQYLTSKYHRWPKFDGIIQQAFPGAPPIEDLYTNVSLILLNSHTSLYPAVPVVPNMVEIGGFFIDPPKKLPKDLQDLLDGAKEGVVYFSMGSTLQSKDITDDKKKMILGVFKNLKQQVLWKFEEDLPEKPTNVEIRKWFPQQDLLAHPNIKLFITHGGLLSITETIYHGVPILAIPVFGDQPINADRAVAGGFALKLNFNDPTFSEETLSSLVKELLENPRYKENALKRSQIYHDRPQKPMDAAVFWVEYVIRHNGAPHLRVAGIKMPWYKYFMVDVFIVLVILVLTVWQCFRFVFRILFCKNKKTSSKLKVS